MKIEAGNSPQVSPEFPRIWIFVDYWNFQLSLGIRFKVDWVKFGPWLAEKAAEAVGMASGEYSYEGMSVYSSYDPNGNGAHYRWATGWLANRPKVSVQCSPRQIRRPPRCPFCDFEIAVCPQCGQSMAGTQEKGVDTLMATDMIRLAWAEAYDLAVLVTNDGDLAPCVQFLEQQSKRVVLGGFSRWGTAMASACSASFDIGEYREEIRMPGT